MHRWILAAIAVLLLSLAIPIARSAGPWTAAATSTETTLVFDPHHELTSRSIYSEQERSAMAAQIDPVAGLLRADTWRDWLRLVRFPESPAVGTPAPDFELALSDGGRLRLEDRRGRIAVFVFASLTSPEARMQVPRFETLADRFRDDGIDVFVVYNRERHAGERGFPDRAPATTPEQRAAHARELAATTALPVAIDAVDDAVARQYGDVPNSAWVVGREGTIVFRATWADAGKVEQVLERMLRHERRSRPVG